MAQKFLEKGEIMFEKLKDFVGINDNYDEYDDDDTNNDVKEVDTTKSDYSRDSSSDVYSSYSNSSNTNDYSSTSTRRTRGGDNIVSMSDTSYTPSASRLKISIQEPVTYDEDAPKVIDDILNKKVVVLNLEMIEVDKKRQILDFVSGAVYALDGKIEKVSKGIFVICPKGIDIDNAVTSSISNGNFYQL